MQAYACVFPGQGSQSVGMLDAWGDHPVVRATLDEASQALGEDLAALIHDGPQEALALTTNTQPVMLVAGVAAYRAWRAEVAQAPVALAGHSLGEYSALVAAGALTLGDAVQLVRFRAQAMQDAVPVGQGAMAAILGLDADRVVAVCEAVAGEHPGQVVEAVNFNDPAQTVIAGSAAAVEAACSALKAAGAKRALPLPVSAPFHSSLMKPAADRLRQRLAEVVIHPPQVPVVNNVDVAVESAPERIREALVRQAAAPVRWVACMQAIGAMGASAVVECGPGKVLAGLCKRILPGCAAYALLDPTGLSAIQTALETA